VPNLRVPEALIARMRRADAAGTACDEGVLIARELAEAVRTRVQGLQWQALLPEFLRFSKASRSRPDPPAPIMVVAGVSAKV